MVDFNEGRQALGPTLLVEERTPEAVVLLLFDLVQVFDVGLGVGLVPQAPLLPVLLLASGSVAVA